MFGYDKKIIKDLFLDCYRGENVLLNLANGGGKSVLVQLLQQPILPESKIHGREVHSYLSTDQASYILIEWKLDNAPRNYLLTGIVMSKQFSSDDMNKTKYFTFVNEYQSSNEYDIQNIPFIQKEDNTVIYKSYEIALKMIRDDKSLENLRAFSRAEQTEYKNKLSEYGIFTNEWKTLAKINENEGGVDEIFKDCKTSDNLINKWILKTVSDSNEAESRELKEMFIALMQEIIEKESCLKEKEILEEFKQKIIEYKEPLNNLLEQLDKEKQIETSIYQIYLTFHKLTQENQEKIEEINRKFQENEKELNKIQYEEISEEYYHLKSDLEAIGEERQEKQMQVERQKQAFEKAKFEYRLQEVAYLHQKEKDAIAQIEALNRKKEDLKDKNDSNEKLRKIEYNLQKKYHDKIVELNHSIMKLGLENEKIKKEIEESKEKQVKNQTDIDKLSIQIGELNEKINRFQKEEKELFDEMKILLSRNLLNELEEKEVQNIKENLERQIEKLKEELEENRKQIESAYEQIKELNQKEEKNHNEIEELTKQETQKVRLYEEYQEKKEEIKRVLDFYRIEEKNIFQKQLCRNVIAEKQMEYKRRIEESINRIDRLKEHLLDLERGEIHNSREVKKVLKDANIEYTTGEEYLKQQPIERRTELLEKNPVLPFCYIVTTKDLERIKTLEIKEETNKLSPIITYSDLDNEVSKDGQFIQLEKMYFLSLYHKECFGNTMEQYKVNLENQLENDKRRKQEEENELDKIEEHMRILKQFDYQENDEIEMKKELAMLEKQIREKKEENESSKSKIEELKEKIEEKNKENLEKQERLRARQQEQSRFLKYLEKNTEYTKEKQQKENYELEIENKKQEIEEMKRQVQTLEENRLKNSSQKREFENQLQQIEERKIKIPENLEEQEILENSMEELEAWYEQLTKEYKQDVEGIDAQIKTINQIKKDAQIDKQKKYSDIKEEDYASIVYSEEIEDFNKEKSEEAERILGYKKEELDKSNVEYIRLDTNFKSCLEKLKKLNKQEALPASQIKRNYEERKNKIAQEKMEGIKEQKEYETQNKKMQTYINDIERNLDVKNVVNKEMNQPNNDLFCKEQREKINLQEQISNYKELKNKNQSYRNSIYKRYVDINSNYRDRHRIINNFLENISVKEAEEQSYDTYYYIYEKMVECLEKLIDYITVLDASLQNIEQDKKNILEHAVKQGVMLYQEMKKISESSKTKVGERYIQILKIEIPEEIKEYVEQRMENYLEECIQSLREECKQSEDVKRTIENKVVSHLSDRRLLNLVLDVETIKVKLYKFDIENRNSGLRYWEDVIVENSGGQKFIACFALFSALVEYTRRKELEKLGEEEKIESSKVFVLDNPFGKTSSKHLLEPMIEIAKKFNTQMICLSDLSQSSITDKFSLIYQLALRNSKYTSNSFLIIENVKNNSEATQDAYLEQVYLRHSIEQISFWN